MEGFEEIEYEDGVKPQAVRVVVSAARIVVNDMIEQSEGGDLRDRIKFLARFVVNSDGLYVARCIKTRDGGLRFENLEAAEAMLKYAHVGQLESAANAVADGMRNLKESAVPLPPGGS